MKIKNLFQIGLLSAFLLVGSCSEDYDGRFDELEQKITNLLAQTQGGAALAASITALQAQVTALSTAVGIHNTASASSLAALSTSVAATNTGLAATNAALATTNAGLATTNAGIATTNTNLTNGLAAVNTSLAGVSTANASLAAGLVSLQTQIDAINVQLGLLATGQATAATTAATTADTQALTTTQLTNAVAALAADVDGLELDLNALLAASDVYTGNLNITNAAELTFAQSLSANLSIISGNVTINNTNISAAEVSAITDKITSVTGTVAVTAIASVDFSALVSVGGAYSVTGFNVADDALTSVGGAVTLNYDGPYSQPNLASAASLALTHFVTGTGVVGNTAVNFSGLTVTTPVTGATTFASAASVDLKNAYSDVIANNANTVNMSAANYAALTISATKTGSAITIAGTVLSGSSGGVLTVTGSATSVLNAAAVTKTAALAVTAKTVDFTALASATTVSLTNTTPVAFPALTTATTVLAPAAVSFTAPVLKTVTSLTLAAATTISAPLTEITIGATNTAFAAVTSLTLGTNAAVTSTAGGAGLDLFFPALKTLWLNGTGPYPDVAITSDANMQNEAITSIKLSGKFGVVALLGTGVSIVTKIETAGNFTSTSVDNFDLMTVLTLEHGHNPTAGGGHILKVDDNALLTTFTTTNLDFVQSLTITDNPKLASFDLSSVKSLLTDATTTYVITITGNFTGGTFSSATGMKGTFTNSTAASASVARVAADLTQASLATLKPFMLAIANGALATPATANIASSIVVNYNTLGAGTASATADFSTAVANNGSTATNIDAFDVADLSSL